MDIIKQANKLIKEGVALLPDEAKGEFKAAASGIFTYEAIENATGVVGDSAEKLAMLEAYSVQEANRVASTLWREGLITPEYEKEYRTLPSMKELADAYNKFTDARKERMDAIMADHKVIAEEEKELDIFKGIINGIAPEESEKRYAEYQKQQQMAMTGGR